MTREEAMEVIKDIYNYTKWDTYTTNEALDMAIKALEIELLTDSEQRIFLTAMSREREVCRKVDDECQNNDSKVSLVRVCNSIERKVKKIWDEKDGELI